MRLLYYGKSSGANLKALCMDEHVWNTLSTKKLWAPLSGPWKGLHRREAICLPHMWQGIHSEGEFGEAWKDPHRREAICMLTMWQGIHKTWGFEDTSKDPHRREAVILLQMWQNISDLKCHERTHTGEKHLSCSKCDKTLVIWSVMKGHTQESGQWLTQHNKCDKSFKRHERSHFFY